MPQNRRFAPLSWVMFALLAFSMVAAASTPSPQPRTLLVLGDSLAAAYGIPAQRGWVALLAERLQPFGWQVVNASISGETTAGGASRIAGELARHQPALVIVELGANDGLRGLPIDLAESNLERIIAAITAEGAQVLLVGMRIPPNYGPDYTTAFEAMYRRLAERHQLALLPFLLEPIAADDAAFQDDRLHPVAEAQPLLLEHLWPALQSVLKHYPPLAAP